MIKDFLFLPSLLFDTSKESLQKNFDPRIREGLREEMNFSFY